MDATNPYDFLLTKTPLRNVRAITMSTKEFMELCENSKMARAKNISE